VKPAHLSKPVTRCASDCSLNRKTASTWPSDATQTQSPPARPLATAADGSCGRRALADDDFFSHGITSTSSTGAPKSCTCWGPYRRLLLPVSARAHDHGTLLRCGSPRSERAMAHSTVRRTVMSGVVLRILTRHLLAPVRWVLLLGNALAILLCGMVMTGWRGPAAVDEITGTPYWPWQALVVMVTLGLVAVTTSIASVRSSGWARAVLVVTTLACSLLAVEVFRSASWDGSSRLSGSCSCSSRRHSRPVARLMEATRCALAFAPFALAAVAVHLSSDVDRAMSSLQALQLSRTRSAGSARRRRSSVSGTTPTLHRYVHVLARRTDGRLVTQLGRPRSRCHRLLPRLPSRESDRPRLR